MVMVVIRAKLVTAGGKDFEGLRKISDKERTFHSNTVTFSSHRRKRGAALRTKPRDGRRGHDVHVAAVIANTFGQSTQAGEGEHQAESIAGRRRRVDQCGAARHQARGVGWATDVVAAAHRTRRPTATAITETSVGFLRHRRCTATEEDAD